MKHLVKFSIFFLIGLIAIVIVHAAAFSPAGTFSLLEPLEDPRTYIILSVVALFFTLGAGSGYSLKPQDVEIPKYIRETLEDIPPGLVRTLLGKKVGTRDIVATLIDLANRGAIRIDEGPLLRLVDGSKVLGRLERDVVEAVFKGHTTQYLVIGDLHNILSSKRFQIQDRLNNLAIEAGFFYPTPVDVRDRWKKLGQLIILACERWKKLDPAIIYAFGLLATILIVGFLVLILVSGLTGLMYFLGAILAVGIMLWLFASLMSRKTVAGLEAKATLQAFKRYLTKIERHADFKTARPQWERYLPYAIAFGLEGQVFEAFAKVDTPTPVWYWSSDASGHLNLEFLRIDLATMIGNTKIPYTGAL